MLKSPIRFTFHPLMVIALILVLTACTTPTNSASTTAESSPTNIAEASTAPKTVQTSVPGVKILSPMLS